MKICLFSADFGHRGCVWDYSGPGRVRWGTIGSMPTNFGNLPKVVERQGTPSGKVSQYWQVASAAGKVPNLEKKSQSEASREVFLSMYITYISLSISTPLAVTCPHGQLASILFRNNQFILQCIPLHKAIAH